MNDENQAKLNYSIGWLKEFHSCLKLGKMLIKLFQKRKIITFHRLLPSLINIKLKMKQNMKSIEDDGLKKMYKLWIREINNELLLYVDSKQLMLLYLCLPFRNVDAYKETSYHIYNI